LVGKDARLMTRLSTVIALVGAASSVAAGAAFANASDGVNVPDSTFRQGTGIQEIEISVAGSTAGSVETLVIWPLYSSNDHWLLSVIAGPSTGASCGYDAGQWQCVPGNSGWHPGDLWVEVSTADAVDCGPASGACSRDELELQSIPFGPNPTGGSPNGRLISVNGSVVITPNPPGSSGPTSAPPASSDPASGSSVTSSRQAPSTSSAAAADAPAAKSSPTSIDAENTSLTAPEGPGLAFFAVLLVAILIGVAAPFGLQAVRRRRKRP
jgi:hypothetical protein